MREVARPRPNPNSKPPTLRRGSRLIHTMAALGAEQVGALMHGGQEALVSPTARTGGPQMAPPVVRRRLTPRFCVLSAAGPVGQPSEQPGPIMLAAEPIGISSSVHADFEAGRSALRRRAPELLVASEPLGASKALRCRRRPAPRKHCGHSSCHSHDHAVRKHCSKSEFVVTDFGSPSPKLSNLGST